MNKNSWLIYVYILVGVIIISSLLYSFNFSLKDIFNKGDDTPATLLTTNSDGTVTAKVSDKNLKSEDYVVELGKSITIKGVNYLFSRVASDTRCVDPAACPEPGKAEIDLLIGGAGAMETVTINTETPATYANMIISIKKLTPIPVSMKETVELTFEIAESVE
jgi:hypothetical protein